VDADDASTLIFWTQKFLEAQGYAVERNLLYQDNKSTILLEMNGKRSSTKKVSALNIRTFFIADQVEKGWLTVEYFPTGSMVSYFVSKPLQVHLFRKMNEIIIGRATTVGSVTEGSLVAEL